MTRKSHKSETTNTQAHEPPKSRAGDWHISADLCSMVRHLSHFLYRFEKPHIAFQRNIEWDMYSSSVIEAAWRFLKYFTLPFEGEQRIACSQSQFHVCLRYFFCGTGKRSNVTTQQWSNGDHIVGWQLVFDEKRVFFLTRFMAFGEVERIVTQISVRCAHYVSFFGNRLKRLEEEWMWSKSGENWKFKFN